MSSYGLCVFLETPEHLQKGRKRYIVISGFLTALRALSASLDAVDLGSNYLYPRPQPGNGYQLDQLAMSMAAALTVLVWGALLVSVVSFLHCLWDAALIRNRFTSAISCMEEIGGS